MRKRGFLGEDFKENLSKSPDISSTLTAALNKPPKLRGKISWGTLERRRLPMAFFDTFTDTKVC
jgi:hypothetical protein